MTSRTTLALLVGAALAACSTTTLQGAPFAHNRKKATPTSGGAKAKTKVSNFDLDKELAKPRFVFEMAGRRDPFVLPLTADPALVDKSNTDSRKKVDPATVARQERTVEKAAVKVQEAYEALEAGDRDRGLALLDEAAKDLKVEDLSPELRGKYEKVRQKVEQLEKETLALRVEKVDKELLGRLDEARGLFDSGQYDEVIKMGKAIDKGLPEDIVKSEKIQRRIEEVSDLGRRAGIRKEFTDHEVTIHGIAMGKRGRIAGVNGTTVAVGEPLPAVAGKKAAGRGKKLLLPTAQPVIEGACIRAIERDAIVIDYKGETIRLSVSEF